MKLGVKKELVFVTAIAALLVAAAWPGFAGPLGNPPAEEAAPADDGVISQPFAPRYDFGPRIIHVPQSDALYDEPGNERPPAVRSRPRAVHGKAPGPGANRDKRQSRQAPPPRRKYHASAPSLSPAERRSLLSASPSPAGPSPVKATPRWRSSDRFSGSPGGRLSAGASDTDAASSEAHAGAQAPADVLRDIPPQDLPTSK